MEVAYKYLRRWTLWYKTNRRFLPTELPKMQKLVGMSMETRLGRATTVISPQTGELLAIYGGTQEHSTDFNRATQARRQAGSSLKPLVYALGFEQKDEKGDYIWKSFFYCHQQQTNI